MFEISMGLFFPLVILSPRSADSSDETCPAKFGCAAIPVPSAVPPSGMTHSSFAWRDDYDIDAATGHDGDGKPVVKYKPEQAFAPASLHTTPLDYARFMIAMMSPENAIATQMLQPQAAINATISWGLGWGLESSHDGAAFWHWGDNGAFKAFCIGYRESQSGVVIMTNGFNGLKLCEPVIQRVFDSNVPGRAVFDWLAEFYR